MRRFLQITLALLLLTVCGGSWYLYRKGFTKPWREWVFDELRRHGVEMTFSKLTVEPFRGLVAKDVKIFDSPARKRVIARVDEMLIEANYARAARGQNFLDALTLADASLELPLDQAKPNGPSVKIERLNTRVLLPQGGVFISRFEAEIFGIAVRASGHLANPDALLAKKKPPAPPGPPGESPLARVIAELRALKFEGAAPRLDVRFSGDAEKPESLVIEVDLAMEKVRRGGYRLESLAVSGSWQNGALLLPRFEAHDSVGRLQLSASCNPEHRTIEARIRSGMDLPGLVRALNIVNVGEFDFHSTPQLDLTARVDFSGKELATRVFGQVRVGPFHYGRVPFDRLSADVSWDGRRWAVRDGFVRHNGGGELRINVQQDYDAAGKGDFRLGLSSTLNPETFASALPAEARERLAMLKFHEAPRITLSARGPTALDAVASGEVHFGRTVYRGIEALRGHANLRYNQRSLYVDNLVTHRSEGLGGGDLVFDFETNLVHIKQVRTALHPQEVMLWIDPDIVADLRPYRFGKKPPNVLIDGVVDRKRDGGRTNLAVKLEAPQMDYTFCGKDLTFTNVIGRLNFIDDRLKLDNVRAGLFGGTVRGDGDISLRKAKPGHAATLRFSDVSFSQLTKLYFDYDESEGKLNGTYAFQGRGDNGRSMLGEGQLTVTEGNVFAIPFLGPFSDVLNKLVPGMGIQRAHKASASFAIAEGVITTKDLVIEGRGFSMIGDGRIWFLDDRMDFDMRLNAQGLPGVLLFPVSKLLEYRSNSKFSKPDWRLKAIPGGRRDP